MRCAVHVDASVKGRLCTIACLLFDSNRTTFFGEYTRKAACSNSNKGELLGILHAIDFAHKSVDGIELLQVYTDQQALVHKAAVNRAALPTELNVKISSVGFPVEFIFDRSHRFGGLNPNKACDNAANALRYL